MEILLKLALFLFLVGYLKFERFPFLRIVWWNSKNVMSDPIPRKITVFEYLTHKKGLKIEQKTITLAFFPFLEKKSLFCFLNTFFG